MSASPSKRPRKSIAPAAGSSAEKQQSQEKWMMTTMAEMQQGNQCCDITVVIGNRHFLCHKTILAAASPFFKAMFTTSMAESKQDVVTLKEFEPEIFSQILDYFYTGKIAITQDSVVDILKSGQFFDLVEVRRACQYFCADNLDHENWYEVYKLREIVPIAKYCFRHLPISYALENFRRITEHENFVNIDTETLNRLITSVAVPEGTTGAKMEERVYQAVIKWYEFDPKSRRGDLENLLENVKFPLMSADFLCNEVEPYSQKISLPRFCELVKEAKMCHLLPRKVGEIVGESKRGSERPVLCEKSRTSPSFTRKLTKLDKKGTHFYPEYARDMFRSIRQMYELDTLCDVNIVVGQQQYQCHQVILAALSPYFRELFSKPTPTQSMTITRAKAAKHDSHSEPVRTVRVGKVDEAIFKQVLDYAYTGIIEITKENVESLVNASSPELYDVKNIREACCNFIGRDVNLSNCLDSIRLYEKLGFQESAEVALEFISRNFDKVKNQPEFIDITGEHLLSIITSQDLLIKKEESLFNGMIKWYMSCPELRRAYLDEMIQHIRFPLMSAEFLCCEVESFAKEVDIQKMHELLEEAKLCHLLPDKRRELIDKNCLRIKPRPNYVSFSPTVKYHQCIANVTFTLLNVSKLGAEYQESPICELRNLMWSLKVGAQPCGGDNQMLAVYVLFRPKSVSSTDTSCDASITVRLLNINKRFDDRVRERPYSKCTANTPYGWKNFIGLKGMMDCKKGFRCAKTDTISFEVNITIGKDHRPPPPPPPAPVAPPAPVMTPQPPVSRPEEQYRRYSSNYLSSSSSDSDSSY